MTMSDIRIRVNKLRAQLLRKGVKVSDEWLNGCAEHFLSENPNMTDQELLEEAYSQWRLADLTEMGVGCLPSSITTNPKLHSIDGRFAVQIHQLLDISVSPYDQLRTMYNKTLDEVIEETQQRTQIPEAKKNRCIRLQISDGVTEVCAMEFKPIPELNVTLPPGTKLLLIGPIKVSKNVLLLGPNNVQVLGGEIEDLLIENAYENVLLKALGKPINPNPKHEYDEEMSIQNFSNNPAISSGRPTFQTNPNLQSSNILSNSNSHSNRQQINRPLAAVRPNTTHPNAQSYSNQVTQDLFDEPLPQDIFDDDDDEEFLSVNLNQIEQSNDQNNSSNKRPSLTAVSTNRTEIVSASSSSSNAFIPQPSSSAGRLSEPPSKVFVHDDTMDEIDYSALEDLSKELLDSAGNERFTEPKFEPPPVAPIRRIEPDSPEYKYKIEGCNVLTIEQLNRIPSARLSNKTFIFFPNTKSVKQKLQISKESDQFIWTITVEFDDGTEEKLEVDFCPEQLERMIGYSAVEMKLMRAEYKKTLGLQEKMTKALADFMNLLHRKDKLWKVNFSREKPRTTGVIDIKPVYKKILMNKVEAEKLGYVKNRIPA